MLITRKLSEFLQEFFLSFERLNDGYQFQRHLRIGLNNYCKLRFDVCISQCQNILPRFLTIASFFETTPFLKCRVDTSLLFFSREGRKRGEMFRNLVPALDNPSLSPNQGITSVNFSQDEAVKAAGNTVSFVFRTKMFGQDTAQERL